MRSSQNSITKEMLKDWDSVRIPVRDYLKRTGKTIPIALIEDKYTRDKKGRK